MGMSMHLSMFRSQNDPRVRSMIDVARACAKAGVELPYEVRSFFKPVFDDYGEIPDDDESVIDCLLEIKINDTEFKWGDGDMSEGFEVDLTKIPKDVKRIRFYCTW